MPVRRTAVNLQVHHYNNYICLLFLQTMGYFYQCVISITDSQLGATVDADSSVTCHLPRLGIVITEAERATTVELQWRNSTTIFTIETSSMEQLSECDSVYFKSIFINMQCCYEWMRKSTRVLL